MVTTRAVRRRNQAAREAAAELAAYTAGLPDLAAEKLDMRREFVAEAVRSSGLVSVTFRPYGTANYLDVYGGKIAFDTRGAGLHGDGIVNDWHLPEIAGFRVRYDERSALVARLDHSVTALDVSNIWLRTADELLDPTISHAEEGTEEHITTTRDGLTILSQSIGHQALGDSLAYIENQIFG